MSTNQGNIGLQLDNAKAPCTVKSFPAWQTGIFYDTLCHRLTASPTLAVLQCGDPTGKVTAARATNSRTSIRPTGTSPTTRRADADLYPRGLLAMANAGPGTNGSQFFLVYSDSKLTPELHGVRHHRRQRPDDPRQDRRSRRRRRRR